MKRPRIIVDSECKTAAKSNNILHSAIGPILLFGQFFGIMPISGAMASDGNKARFKWCSIQVLVSITILLLGLIEIIFTTIRVLKRGLKLYAIGAVVFYSICETGLILFFLLAIKWPKIIRIWQRTEEVFLQSPYRMYIKVNLKTRVRTVAFSIIFLALYHALYLCTSILASQEQIEKCNITYGIIENFFRRERAHIFDLIYFKYWMIPILEWNNISLTLCWSFTDIFLSIISIAIAERFRQITERLKVVKSKVMPESFWIEVRYHYINLSDLVVFLDQELSGLILLSCANNLYFICVQLFNSSLDIPRALDKIYFWFSIMFVIGRTLCMLFCASSINDASREPLPILRNIPSKCWSLDVQRFANQVRFELVAFSGKRFFFLTRKLIFAMAGTVVTYELVLLDQITEISDGKQFCQIYGKI